MFRDQREVDIWYGCCPDCGDMKSPQCHCAVPDHELPPLMLEEFADDKKFQGEDGGLPF